MPRKARASSTAVNTPWPSVWIEPRKRKKGTSWLVCWQTAGPATRRKRAYRIKPIAERAAAKKRLELEAGKAGVEIPPERLEWRAYAEEYLAHCKAHKAANTIEHFDAPAIRSFTEMVNPDSLGSITPGAIERWKLELLKKYSPSTVSMRLRCVKAALAHAVRLGYMAKNPAAAVRKPREVRAGKALTNEQIVKLLRAASARIRPAIVFALHTGFRRGEVLALDWIWIRKPRKGSWEATLPAEHTKTGAARIVPLDAGAVTCVGRPQSELR
ncbi:MAG: phage integrase SAM-like domain-containing protein [Elusimicrobiota bacterium]